MFNFHVISLTINEDILSLKKGDKMDFVPGLNVIVGDQGSGKSTLLNILSGAGNRSYEKSKFTLELTDEAKETKVKTAFFDTEKSNPRTSGRPVETMGDIALIWSSHGEANLAILQQMIEKTSKKGNAIFIDEPESGLSIRNQIVIIDLLKKAGELTQVFVSTHSETMIRKMDKVLNMETKTWMTPEEFINSHLS